MDRHPGPVLGGGGPGPRHREPGELYGDHSGGEVGAGARLERGLKGPPGHSLVLLLTGEDELRLLPSGLPPVVPPRGGHGHVLPLDGHLSARRGNLLGGCEADVPHTLELASLLDQALGDHSLPLRPGARTQQVVRTCVMMLGNQFVGALYRDLNLLWFSGHVKTRVIISLTLQG